MRRFTGMRGEAGRLERELRAARPEPRADFLVPLAQHVAEARPSRHRSRARVAFALALSTFVVGSVASFGGLSYAASGAASAADVVKEAVGTHDPPARLGTAAQAVHGPPAAPAEEQAAAGGEVAQAAGAERLPFTGISLLVTAILGLALLATGLILRRGEKRKT